MMEERYARTIRYYCPECKITARITKEAHDKSSAHLNREILLGMVDKGATLQEMGNVLGVSRERIRQILRKLCPDNDRVAKRAYRLLEKTWSRVEANYLRKENRVMTHPIFVALKKKCEGIGVSFDYFGLSTYYVLLNGKKCRVKRGHRMWKDNGRYMRVGDFHESPPDSDTEFLVVSDPVALDDWWIFPIEDLPIATSWTREETSLDYYLEPRYSKYLKFKNAWHLLKGEENVPRP